MKLKPALIYTCTLFFCFALNAQTGVNKDKFRLEIQPASDKIMIDGLMMEQSWKNAKTAKDFFYKWPKDTGEVPLKTEVKATYNENFLYIAATCFDDGEHVIRTLKRDVMIWGSDGFGVMLDPLNQQTNGFIFYTNPLGVQTEGLLSGMGSGGDGMSRDWDNKWFVETNQNEDGSWTLEMAIPFKTLRYNPNIKEWGINFIRCDLGNNAYSTWAKIPLQMNGTDISFMGTLEWKEPPSETKSNFSIIPYITGGVSQDYEDGDGTVEPTFDLGLDAKVAVSSSLNLDLTVNPDFSQIEVDVQQTNLTRFNLFFPERRTFFLENSDLFADYGIRPIRPFFSRRIGLDDDGNAIPIVGGARLSGNLTESLRVGLMSMQTGKTDEQAAQNYSVATFQQRIFKRSSIQGIYINRQSFTGGEVDKNDFGRNFGGEFNYVVPDGKWSAWAGIHGSIKPEKFAKTNFFQTGFNYSVKRFEALNSFASVGENYIADVGFIRRLDNYDAARDTTVRLGYHQLFSDYTFRIFPKNESTSIFNRQAIGLQLFNVWNEDWSRNLSRIEASYNINLKNTSGFSVGVNFTSETLPFETNLIDEDLYDNLPVGVYNYTTFDIGYDSNSRKLFGYELGFSIGEFYNGSIFQFEAEINYRKQPWGVFALNFERNIVTLPENFGEARLWLIGPKIEINFNKNMFWTTFLQYNTQADNFNINSRLQWRYSPMSDLFIVYTDNYSVENFGLKTRAFVLKLNYWLTI